jgi:hypothetical protein
VLPREYLSTELIPLSLNELYSVYVHPKDFDNIRPPDNRVVRLSKVQPQQPLHNKETSQQQHHNKETLQQNNQNEDKSEMDNKSYSQNTIYVKVVKNSNVIPGHVVLCESIRDCLDAENFSIIR